MNLFFLAAAIITLIAALAHLLVGTKESLSTKPLQPDHAKLSLHWHQLYAAWHLVSADLFFLSGLLFWMSYHPGHQAIIFLSKGISIWMMLWAISWLISLMSQEEGKKYVWKLAQWVVFLSIAGLTYFGA